MIIILSETCSWTLRGLEISSSTGSLWSAEHGPIININLSKVPSEYQNISIEKAKTDPTNSVIYNYELPENSLLTNIKYQDKNNLICMTNNEVYSFDISDI